MKFDCVIGNPPYQFNKKNNREKLWTRFVNKAFEELVNDTGVVALVTPTSWMSPSSDYANTSIFNDYFRQHDTIVINIDECNKHFPGVGSSFSYYIVSTASRCNKTKIITPAGEMVIDLNNPMFDMGVPVLANPNVFSIANKFFKHDPFPFHRQYNGAVAGKNFDDNGKYKVFHTASKIDKTFTNYASKHHTSRKVMVSLSGKYKPVIDDGNYSPSDMVVTYTLRDEDNLENAGTVFNSNIYTFIIDKAFRYNGWVNLKVVYNLPKVDLTRTWTDAELYDHFGLTEEERLTVQGKI